MKREKKEKDRVVVYTTLLCIGKYDSSRKECAKCKEAYYCAETTLILLFHKSLKRFEEELHQLEDQAHKLTRRFEQIFIKGRGVEYEGEEKGEGKP